MSRALLAGALLLAVLPFAPARAGAGAPEQAPGGDGGQAASATSTSTSDEDREVIENLDLLQAMGGAKDLDLLLELNKGADGPDGD